MDATAPPSPPPADIEDTAAAGKCLCGATSYRITKLDERSPGQILVCHCSMCRCLSGGFNMPFAAFPREYIEFGGSEQLKRIRSSEVAERLFCGGCGSQVGMDYGKTLEPDSLWLTLGLGVGDNSSFLRHIIRAGGTSSISLRNACSRIFMDNRCKVQLTVEALPGRDGFGTWQCNPCGPKDEDSLPKSGEGVEDTLARLMEKQNLHK